MQIKRIRRIPKRYRIKLCEQQVSELYKLYKKLDATRDKSNDEFIEELIDECLEEIEQVSENMTLDEIIKNFNKTYEEFKFKYFLIKVLQKIQRMI